MDGKNTILRGLVEGIVKELYPQTSVYNVRVDDTTMLAQKLAEMISALNGKVTQQQLADAIEQALSELGAVKGEKGDPGVGIKSVVQTGTSNVDGGTNVITVTLDDGTSSAFQVRNGGRGSPGEPGAPGVAGIGIEKVEQTTASNADSGTNVVTIMLTDGSTATVNIKNGSKGSKGDPGEKGDRGDPGDSWTVTPYDYGYTGSGDATSAIQQAMANNRRVFIPGGDYTVSGELLIRDNCQLELAQDAVLYFKQTSGNCISLKQCAWLKGNHATVSVPYTFAGKVLNADTDLTTAVNDCPPFKKWDPMWKNGRYVTDLNIVKPDTRGFYYSMDGSCNGTAVYLCANGEDVTTWLWGVNYSGLRIAGAFTYGVHAENFNFEEGDGGWNHEMRIEAFIDGAETGVRLDNCHNAYLSTIVQPRRAYTTSEVYVPYAKYGIYLNKSKNCDLSGSRVWDWDSEKTLWTEGGIYQHLALIGDCRGLITNEYYYYSNPNYDIRDLIYTDTPGNLERMIILQEPFTRWYKPIDHEPYFFDGDDNKKLALKDDLDCIVDGERKPAFTNALLTATDTDGIIYNGTGYTRYGYQLNASGNVVAGAYNGCTGFIPVKQGDVIYSKNIKLDSANVVVVTYDANKSYIVHGTSETLAGMTFFFDYTPTDDGFILKVKQRSTTAYIRFCYRRDKIGERPIISVNQPIEYVNNGYLRETIKVKASQVEGLPSGGSGSGGGGADLLDSNGIIKQEYLPDGFPYKSGDDNAVILPSTALEVDPDAGFMIVPEVVEFTLGLEYTVTWNGTAYACTCVEFIDPGSEASLCVLGNLGALGSGEITDHPFLILAYPKEFADEYGFNCLIMAIDGSATATVSIAGFVGNFQRMDEKFLPVMEPETVIVTAFGDHGSGVEECSHTYEEMNELAKRGKNLVLDVTTRSDDQRRRFHLVTWGWNNVTFNRFDVSGSSAIIADSIVFYSNRTDWNRHVITSDV